MFYAGPLELRLVAPSIGQAGRAQISRLINGAKFGLEILNHSSISQDLEIDIEIVNGLLAFGPGTASPRIIRHIPQTLYWASPYNVDTSIVRSSILQCGTETVRCPSLRCKESIARVWDRWHFPKTGNEISIDAV
jgi:hypothetical protein